MKIKDFFMRVLILKTLKIRMVILFIFVSLAVQNNPKEVLAKEKGKKNVKIDRNGVFESSCIR
jgi:hypothetical protein